MQFSQDSNSLLISVIIACYNQGRYLKQAIESVLRQHYQQIEVIVVDDGSTDCTRVVAREFEDVTYIYQLNEGLSAARNTGLLNSRGSYLVFLDADDWLLPNALTQNLSFLLNDNALGLVAGSYINYYEATNQKKYVENSNGERFYTEFLQKNIIRMHAAVMYPRWIFDFFRFDTSLSSCEDWDIYLKVSRKFKVFSHESPIAVYRRRNNSMSGDNFAMLKNALKVLNHQADLVKTKAERKSLRIGKKRVRRMYSKKLYYAIIQGTKGKNYLWQSVIVLLRYDRLYCIKLIRKLVFDFYSKTIQKCSKEGGRWLSKASL